MSGEKKEPRALDKGQTQNDVVLGWYFNFFKNEKTKNDVILG